MAPPRRECLDWLLIRNDRHLERVLEEFVAHYNSARPHRGIDLEVPVPRVPDGPLDGSVQIRRIDRLGGVLQRVFNRCLSKTARTIGALAVRCNSRNPPTRDVEAVPGRRPQRITEDARLLTSWHPEPVSTILVLRGVGILSLHPTGQDHSIPADVYPNLGATRRATFARQKASDTSHPSSGHLDDIFGTHRLLGQPPAPA